MTRLGAVTFDAMGTLVAIEPPAPRLQQSLERRLGLAVDLGHCEAAMRVEMRHYRAHCAAARDAPGLAALRLECSSLLADALALEVSGAELLPSLTDAISFYAYPDAQPALERLAAAGLKLAVVANWDISLHDVLARLGLASSLDAVVTAARSADRSPTPAIARRNRAGQRDRIQHLIVEREIVHRNQLDSGRALRGAVFRAKRRG